MFLFSMIFDPTLLGKANGVYSVITLSLLGHIVPSVSSFASHD
jgi:hypothetical protein